jgi:hypothetical protein
MACGLLPYDSPSSRQYDLSPYAFAFYCEQRLNFVYYYCVLLREPIVSNTVNKFPITVNIPQQTAILCYDGHVLLTIDGFSSQKQKPFQ